MNNLLNAETQTAKMKILIIEDDNTISSALSYALSQEGYDTTSCMLLRKAKELLCSDSFDLIISDIGLPDGNGLDFCGQSSRIPFILMSGFDDIAPLAMKSGAKAFVEKPFTVDTILSAVKGAL